jgi:hypothetical protein
MTDDAGCQIAVCRSYDGPLTTMPCTRWAVGVLRKIGCYARRRSWQLRMPASSTGPHRRWDHRPSIWLRIIGYLGPPERMLSCLDIGTMASEDRCREGGHSSGRLSEAS